MTRRGITNQDNVNKKANQQSMGYNSMRNNNLSKKKNNPWGMTNQGKVNNKANQQLMGYNSMWHA